MIEINLSAQQAQILRGAEGELVLRDANGECLATGHCVTLPAGVSADEAVVVAECLRRRTIHQKRHSADDVITHLESLRKE